LLALFLFLVETYFPGITHINKVKFWLEVEPVGKQEEAVNFRLVITSLFSGLKYVIALLLITIILLAVTYWLGWDWSAYEHTIYQYSIYAAIMLGALVTGYKAKMKGWLMGILLAVAVWLLFFIVGRIIGVEQDINKGFINGGIGLFLGILGGVIGINL
jgi:putative membrane protein (TIGR04086 family)